MNTNNKEDNEDTMSKAKELFEMVYQWGRVGVVTNEKAPAFQQIVTELVREKKPQSQKITCPNCEYVGCKHVKPSSKVEKLNRLMVDIEQGENLREAIIRLIELIEDEE